MKIGAESEPDRLDAVFERHVDELLVFVLLAVHDPSEEATSDGERLCSKIWYAGARVVELLAQLCVSDSGL